MIDTLYTHLVLPPDTPAAFPLSQPVLFPASSSVLPGLLT